ncbi:glycosyltransferase family 1 protein [Mesorhizobium sp. M7A.F.Ca.US.006.04.2.1]|uniref:glycosyltransferase family 4 protein n=3 Tax=Mesorhizobium TaxID=68287 RepID=UPI0004831BB9|nr:MULTISPECIES: glycosyltransferase family 1 protein [unclassified Mesorhizobium]RUZ88328.1 glycosyltransferase family 1 protein [Mesorhizobium sp. M7A.F.Ca.US.003.02.2.1]MBZ9891094.1 glycosyltransferase family 1 protein [Mesorhizobium sp. BR1-1-3]MDF3150468.1 glycosyltransferase family 1 protein [Mesorhizobium sp. XAP10]MDF3243354.1 glycosyltransferase family 1 protein [Mesorhizobium sp. XAP4]RUX76431.1 glycosyltransferase family 1 protein [Mesorhizobium sp. M7A.F.Ca.US.005.03.1.1]
MRILMVTDAWRPQVNGVVHTLERLTETLKSFDVAVDFLTPNIFRTLPLPTYPDIRLALTTPGHVARLIDAGKADHIHIVTEGPLGIMARRYCRNAGRPFTTSYHTRFPEYLSARLPVPESWAYRWLRDFHNSGQGTLVATQSLADDLSARGFTKLRPWTRGVDTDHFRPDRKKDLGFPGPIFLCVGRVAIEKNLGAFLDLDLPGSKVIVGEGPELARLKAKYPQAHFLGHRPNDELAEIYASADVFVFPSRTDTFGNVIIEALASGTPVAAYPVTGPIDIVGDGFGGAVSNDLREASLAALNVDRAEARERAMRYSWKACAEMFLDTVEEALGTPRKLAA